MPGQTIVVVTGPTAVGKTQVAIELARRFDGELIGADSVQVYRGFDIGSAKPTARELAGVVHHLIDVREPEEALDAASYAALADRAIEDVSRRGRLPIVVGGTGLWLRALLRGLVDLPPVDRALRARLEAEWDARGGLALHMQLAQVDAESAARIHPNDKLRVVRALEVYAQTGRPLGAARDAHALGAPRYRDRVYVLDLPMPQYRERVRTRCAALLEAGFAAEVSQLLRAHGPEVKALGAVGYKQIAAHLQAGVSLAETEREFVRATLLYARRQRTWWNREPGVYRRLSPQELLAPACLGELAAFLADRT